MSTEIITTYTEMVTEHKVTIHAFHVFAEFITSLRHYSILSFAHMVYTAILSRRFHV